jgi:fatty acid desaturase
MLALAPPPRYPWLPLVIFAFGIWYVLRVARRGAGGPRAARWIPWVVMFSCPLAVAIWWAVAVPLLGQNQSEQGRRLLPLLILGSCIGALVAFLFGLVLHVNYRFSTKPPTASRDEAEAQLPVPDDAAGE